MYDMEIIGDKISSKVRNKVWHQVWALGTNQVWLQVWEQSDYRFESQIIGQIMDQIDVQLQKASI